MFRKWLAVIVLLVGIYLIIPDRTNDNPDSTLELSPQNELNAKQSILEQDLALSEQLCTDQCIQILTQTLDERKNSAMQKPGMQQFLDELRSKYPHMKLIVYKERNEEIASSAMPFNAAEKEQINHSLQSWEQELANRPYFVDNSVKIGEKKYKLIGVNHQNGGRLFAFVDQNMLQQLQSEQRKNLRMVPYPSDMRPNIQSVDPHSLRQLEVDHPEDNEGASHYYKHELIVKFKKMPTKSQLAKINKEIDGSNLYQWGNTYVFTSKKWDMKQLKNYFEQHFEVEYTEPHYMYLTNVNWQHELSEQKLTVNQQSFEPNDTLFRPYQWNLPKVGTLDGWNLSRGSEDVIIAVLDTGVDLQHTDLQQNLVEGYNVIDPSLPPYDDVGHGTHVAGVIAAIVNNGEGIAGMSWFNKVMPVKVLDETGAGSAYSVAQGVVWATENGAKVLNMSLGNYADAEFLHDAIRYAFERDVLIIAATGNDNTENKGFPAAYPEVFAVGATDITGRKASFSNYGNYLDVTAPGVNIASTYPGNQYVAMSGTSMAAPHVAALGALIRSAYPELTNVEVMEMMRRSAIDLGQRGYDKYYGYGLISVPDALSSYTHYQDEEPQPTNKHRLQRTWKELLDWLTIK